VSKEKREENDQSLTTTIPTNYRKEEGKRKEKEPMTNHLSPRR